MMTYPREQIKMGLMITIKTDRNKGNGGKGGGRKGTGGWKATVLQEDCEKVILRASTATVLLQVVRDQYKIPPHIRINREGETRI